MSRTKLSYVPYDIDFFSKEVSVGIMRRFGSDAMILYMQILQSIGGKDSGRIRADAIPDLCFRLRFNEAIVEPLLSFCFERGYLFTDGCYVTNSRIDEAQQVLAETRADNADRKAAERERKKATETPKKEEPSKPVTNLSQNGNCDAETSHSDALNSLIPSLINSLVPSLVPSEEAQGEDPPPKEDETTDDAMAVALKHLEDPEGKPWANSSTFMNTGRRPMKKYPELWFTAPELADVLRDFEKSDIPKDKWQKAFKLAQSTAKKPGGLKPEFQNAFVLMTGWVKATIMKEIKEENYMKRSKEVVSGKA